MGQLACLLQSVHRFVDAGKEVGFAGGGRLREDKVREDRVREKVGWDLDELGMGKGSAEIIVREVYCPEEGMTRHDRDNSPQGREAT